MRFSSKEHSSISTSANNHSHRTNNVIVCMGRLVGARRNWDRANAPLPEPLVIRITRSPAEIALMARIPLKPLLVRRVASDLHVFQVNSYVLLIQKLV